MVTGIGRAATLAALAPSTASEWRRLESEPGQPLLRIRWHGDRRSIGLQRKRGEAAPVR